MAKALIRDIRSILRQFEIAGELTSQSEIFMAKQIELRQGSYLISFLFGKTRYYILIDALADDDQEYIIDQINSYEPEVTGKLIVNPLDERTTFGVPFKGKDVYLFEVIKPKKRLDTELSRRYPSLSRSTLQKYIKAGYVQVNGSSTTKPKAEVRETDDIAMTPPSADDFSTMELPIVYIDDNVIVVNKPAGVLTHSKGALNNEFTVADFFRRYTTYGLETTRPGIVHRLDRDTSGIMIGARHDDAAAMLKKQFADRRVIKEYVAITDGIPQLPEAIIDLPIGRHPSKPSTFRVDSIGKPAMTKYNVIDQHRHKAFVRLQPKTGRTHQLRVHMQYIKTPIHGDKMYGVKADRLYLHAHTLTITIPSNHSSKFEAAIPKEFTTALL